MVMLIKRQDALKMSLTSEMKGRLERLAQLVGVPPATLASLAVGQYVVSLERSLGAAERMADAIGGQVGAEVKRQMGLFSKENVAKEP